MSEILRAIAGGNVDAALKLQDEHADDPMGCSVKQHADSVSQAFAAGLVVGKALASGVSPDEIERLMIAAFSQRAKNMLAGGN